MDSLEANIKQWRANVKKELGIEMNQGQAERILEMWDALDSETQAEILEAAKAHRQQCKVLVREIPEKPRQYDRCDTADIFGYNGEHWD